MKQQNEAQAKCAQWCREFMVSRKLTQVEFAHLSLMSPATISLFVNGTPISERSFVKIKRFMNTFESHSDSEVDVTKITSLLAQMSYRDRVYCMDKIESFLINVLTASLELAESEPEDQSTEESVQTEV